MTTHRKNRSKATKKRWVLERITTLFHRYWEIGYCTLISLLFVLSPRLINLSYGLVDPSFNYAFNKAAAERLAFGSGFITTYGPLGYLISTYLPQYIYNVSIWIILYSVFLSAGVYLIVKYYTKISNVILRLTLTTGLIYIFSITNEGNSLEWNLISLFLLYCFLFLKFNYKKRLLLSCVLSIFAAIFLLIDYTIGSLAISTLFILALFSTSKQWRKKAELLFIDLGTFLTTFLILGSFLGIKNFIDYIKTGIILSNGFSEAMPFFNNGTVLATILLALCLIIIFLWASHYKERKFYIKYTFILPSLFIIWKYSVVRQDSHLMASVLVIWPLTALIFFSKESAKKKIPILLIIVALSMGSVLFNGVSTSGPSLLSEIYSPIRNVINIDPINFFRFSHQKKLWSRQSKNLLRNAVIPRSMKKEIKNSGVDIFPWETDIIAANNLTWQPRPSPFSFESYNPYFDNANSRYYNSIKAPKFIIWHNTGVKSIDYRYLLWDEPKTLRTILRNYNVIDYSNRFMLLKKSMKTQKANIKRVETIKTQWGKWITIPSTTADSEEFAKIFVNRDFISKATSILLRSDVFQIQLRNNRTSIRYQFVLENGPQGFLINNLPLSWKELISLMSNKKFQKNNETSFRLLQESSLPPTHSPVIVKFFSESFNK